jgi:hypothetical protein
MTMGCDIRSHDDEGDAGGRRYPAELSATLLAMEPDEANLEVLAPIGDER